MDDFDDEDFDESTVRQLAEIESNLLSGRGRSKATAVHDALDERRTGKPVLPDADVAFDVSSDWDDDELIQYVTAAERRHLQSTKAKTPTTEAKLPSATAAPAPMRAVKAPTAKASAVKAPVHIDPHSGTSARNASALPFTKTLPANGTASRSSRTSRNVAVAGPSRQMTLFGETLSPQGTQGILIQANRANSAIGPASQQARQAIASILAPTQGSASTSQRGKTKQWDFAQPILRPKKAALKVDPEGIDEFEDESLDDMIGGSDAFDLPPPPLEKEVESLRQMKVQIDREAAKTWIYPTNKEKRDYQFNIVQRALFNNVLVALPTGLGKTFIAAVVILNYFRWFPEGKIIFVAPTKPLVAQQQCACHGICGLPWDTAIEMTGETKASLRAEEWKSKRIFYMTPQTFENDLCSTAIDAEDVVCVVVDEAHRATGNYAYGKVIRHLMMRNPFFRVLALTATPGSNSDKVQEVVDSLHINLIEIRQEDALDIRKYVHAKDEDPVVVPLRGVVGELRDLLCKLMKPSMDILIGAGVLQNKDPVSLAPFAVRSIYKDPRKKDIVAKRRLYNHIKDLGELAQAMENLVKYSVTMFASKMWSLETGISEGGTKASSNRQLSKYSSNSVVREMRRRYEECQDEEGFVPHPKMDYLQNVIAAHFANAEDNDTHEKRNTRVMVFCSYRECVTEIVALLNRVPSVKATQFVGQSTDRKGNRGLRQKDQERIVADFKKGEFNVLVATSIGEEGLDIGEVDLIVCYEAVKNAVRMLQRVGRTGRKREGRIVVLMAEGPEEKNWQQSKDQYRSIQHDIIKGINLSLYDDVERLVPADITSEVHLLDVDQPPFEPSMIRNQSASKKRSVSGDNKRKRDTNPMRNVPDGALTGFVKVSALRKPKAKAGVRSAGKDPGKQRAGFEREGDDDDDDDDDDDNNNTDSDERNLGLGFQLPRGKQADILDDGMISDETDEVLERGLLWEQVPQPPQDLASTASSSISSNASAAKIRGRVLGTRRIQPMKDGSSAKAPTTIIPLDISPKSGNTMSSENMSERGGRIPSPVIDARFGISSSDNQTVSEAPMSSSPVVVRRRTVPHPLVAQLAAETAGSGSDSEEDVGERRRKRTFVRRGDRVSPATDLSVMGPPAPPSIHDGGQKKVGHESNEQNRSTRPKKRRMGDSPTGRRLFQLEADRSTDEEVHGERDERDEGDSRYEEDSSDREHVGDFLPTQAPKGYKQQAVYLQSLSTQTAPPMFQRGAPRAVRASVTQRSPHAINSSTYSGLDEDSEDEYEVGSFVCSDDEVVFDSDAEPSQPIDRSL